MMTETIILVIKAVNQSVVDQKLECDLSCTVKYVKEEIRKYHPESPAADEQRLIYSGHLLQDHITLKSILRYPSEDNSYIIHLVCSTLRQATAANTASPKRSAKQTSSPVRQIPQNSASNNSSEAPSSSSTPDGVRQRFATSNVASDNSRPQPTIDPSRVYSLSQFPPTMQGIGDPMQQLAAMQHMYAQYMASYMQYVQSGSMNSVQNQQDMMHSLSTNPTASANIVTDTLTPQNGAPGIANQEPDPNIAPHQQPARPNDPNRRNAQGGGAGGAVVAEQEDEAVPRDWLDYMYFASRMLILVCVVYFYSTITRFIIVIISCVAMYMYQLGWFNPLRRVEPQLPPVVAAPVPEEPNAPPEDAGARDPPEEAASERAPDGGGSEGELSSSSDNTILEPPQPSILALSWTFLTSFFTSLIPDQPQII